MTRIVEKMSEAQVAEIRRLRPEMRATHACEGMYLTAEEEALFDEMEAERLTPDQRIERIIAFNKERHAHRASSAPAISTGPPRD